MRVALKIQVAGFWRYTLGVFNDKNTVSIRVDSNRKSSLLVYTLLLLLAGMSPTV